MSKRKKRYPHKAERHTQKKQSHAIQLIYLSVAFIIWGIYVTIIARVCHTIYPGTIYFSPRFSMGIGILSILFLILWAVYLVPFRWEKLRKHPTIITLLSILSCVVLLLPLVLSKAGITADSAAFQKKDLFGRTTAVYPYEDIKNVDISVKFGIQYEIVFLSGDKLQVYSHNLGFNAFGNDENLVQFDKCISSYCTKQVTENPRWLTPSNTRRFFKTKSAFEYFDRFFQQYYLERQGDSSKTGDGSMS